MTKSNLRWIRKIVYLHPLLLTLFFPLYFYFNNINIVFPHELPPIIVAAFLHSLLLGIVAALISRGKPVKTIRLTSYFILLTTLFPALELFALYHFPVGWRFEEYEFYASITLLAELMIAAAIFSLCCRTGIREHILLFIMGLSLTGYNAVKIVAHGTPNAVPQHTEQVHLESAPTVPKTHLPHIVYIIPDRYPGLSTLRTDFKHDNQPFLNALTERGFHVAEPSFANYTKTFQSIASMMNMQYLSFLAAEFGENNPSNLPVYYLMQNHQALQVLDKAGYYYLHMGNWWGPTRANFFAEENFSGLTFFQRLSEFQRKYVETNALASLFVRLSGSFIKQPCELIHAQRDKVLEAVQRDEPQFIFWHLLLPHPPFIFNRDGECLDIHLQERGMPWGKRNAKFLNQMLYTNTLLLETFDRVKASSSRDFIFVIQSDEGPFPQSYIQNPLLNWPNSPDETLRTKYGIINAFYFSDHQYAGLEKVHSPVNNMRIVLNKATGTSFPPLDQRLYTFQSERRPYKFTDITDRLIPPPPAPPHAKKDE